MPSWQQAAASSPGGYPTTRRPQGRWTPPTGRFASPTEMHLFACVNRIRPQGSLSVVDLGGAFGQLAQALAWALPQVRIDWTVWELPEVVRAAHDVCATGDNLTLRFTADAPTMPVDLVIASAVLQYLPEGLGRLEALAGLARWILVDRLPVWPIARDQTAVQHASSFGPALYPVWFFAEAAVDAALRHAGEIELRWRHSSDTAFFAGVRCDFQGVLLRVR